MSNPVTAAKSLITPNTGDLSGTWGTAAVNPNFQIIDAMFGGTTTISLSGATTILLTVPSTTGDWAGTIPQSTRAFIKFTGAQTGSAVIQFSLPGFYIVQNACTGTTFIKLSPATGAGSSICAPPGKKCTVFFDGTDMDYVDPPEVGSPLDLFGQSSLPPWISNCSFQPYLVRDGSIHTASLYPQLAQILGSTFGGNGVTTFGVPDSRSRNDVGIDIAKAVGGGLASRITTAIAGFSGTTMAASGGSESMQAHRHDVTDPGHTHTSAIPEQQGTTAYGVGAIIPMVPGSTTINVNLSTTSISLGTTGAGGSQNMPPTIVSFLPLIKT